MIVGEDIQKGIDVLKQAGKVADETKMKPAEPAGLNKETHLKAAFRGFFLGEAINPEDFKCVIGWEKDLKDLACRFRNVSRENLGEHCVPVGQELIRLTAKIEREAKLAGFDEAANVVYQNRSDYELAQLLNVKRSELLGKPCWHEEDQNKVR